MNDRFVLACGSYNRAHSGFEYLNVGSSGNRMNQFNDYTCCSLLSNSGRVDLRTDPFTSIRYDRKAKVSAWQRICELGHKGLAQLKEEGKAEAGDIIRQPRDLDEWFSYLALRIWCPSMDEESFVRRTWGEIVGLHVEHHRHVDPLELSHAYEYIGASLGLTAPAPNMGKWWIFDGEQLSIEEAQNFVEFWWRFTAHPMSLENNAAQRVTEAQSRIILIPASRA